MPNWCNNELRVRGKKAEVDALLKKAYRKDKDGETAFSFQSLLPMPKELEGTTAPSKDGKDWYNWRCENWGIKWDVEATINHQQNFKNGNSEVLIIFESPWGPPLEGIESISALYPTLTFAIKWDEPGMGENGREVFENGSAA